MQTHNNHEIIRKSLLYRSNVEYADWTINHVLGCSHGCGYCYAEKLKRRTGAVLNHGAWCSPQLVANASELLEEELAKWADRIDTVHFSFTTDPFMFDIGTQGPRADIAEKTLELIGQVNAAGIPVTVLTKGRYPNELFERLDDLDERNEYGITVTSLNDEFLELWEPGAAHPWVRILWLAELHRRGARTWVSVEPYPTPNLDVSATDPRSLLEAVGFAGRFVYGRANYVRQVTEYLKEDPDFYDRMSEIVDTWCTANDKPVIFKHGTWSDADTACEVDNG